MSDITRNRLQATPKPNARPRLLPDAVIRDKRLKPAALVIAAWQNTFVGDYVVRATTLSKHPIVRADKRGTGLGSAVIKRVNSVLRAAGYKRRWQPPSKGRGSFSRAVERLTLPPSGKAGIFVRRAWFDGQLSLNEMAAYLYFLAGTGNGPRTYATELAERFEWSRPTAAKAISALIRFGLLAKVVMRTAGGQIRCIGYRALPWRKLLSKSQPTKSQPTKKRPTYIRTPFYINKRFPSLLSDPEPKPGLRPLGLLTQRIVNGVRS